jgi:Tol biopolymer transport system component
VGNNPLKVVEDAEQGDWSPDGKQIAFIRFDRRQDRLRSVLFLIDAAGGVEREIARFDGELLGYPRWSPDGRHLILNTPPFITSGVLRKLTLVDVKDGTSREIRPDSLGMLSTAAWLSSDEIVFMQSESITGGGTAVSAARAFRENVRTLRQHPLFWVGSSGTTLDLLPDGRVVFDSMTGRQNLREYPLDGHGPPRWITHGTVNDRQPVFAPDGEWVVFSSNRSGNLDLWAISTRTDVVRSLTDDPADDWDPGFSPDGRSLLWSSNRSGNLEVWASNPDGTGAHQVTHDGVDAQNPTQTRDGKWIVYSCANRQHQGLWKIHPDGTGAELLARGAAQVPQVSPDGNWAAYLINDRTTSILHVIRVEDANDMTFAVLPEPRRKTQIQRGRARWTPDGNRILFTGQDQKGLDGIFIQDFVPGKDTASTRRPLAGFDPEWITESLGLSPDGRRLVLSEAERVFSLMVAEGVPGLAREKGSKR